MLLATARSLVATGTCEATHMAMEVVSLELANEGDLLIERQAVQDQHELMLKEQQEKLQRLQQQRQQKQIQKQQIAASKAAAAPPKTPASKKDASKPSATSSKPGPLATAAKAEVDPTLAPSTSSQASPAAPSPPFTPSTTFRKPQLQLEEPDAPILERRFPPYAKLIMEGLSGPLTLPLDSLPFLAESYLNDTTARLSHISGDRAEKEPYGPADNGGAARILPVALAYR
jgi:hypothetical protein